MGVERVRALPSCAFAGRRPVWRRRAEVRRHLGHLGAHRRTGRDRGFPGGRDADQGRAAAPGRLPRRRQAGGARRLRPGPHGRARVSTGPAAGRAGPGPAPPADLALSVPRTTDAGARQGQGPLREGGQQGAPARLQGPAGLQLPHEERRDGPARPPLRLASPTWPNSSKRGLGSPSSPPTTPRGLPPGGWPQARTPMSPPWRCPA